jgi:phosphoserine aminotransferase
MSDPKTKAFDSFFVAALAAEKYLHGTQDPEGRQCARNMRAAIYAIIEAFSETTTTTEKPQ